MTGITLDDIVFPAVVSLLAGFQLGTFAKAVGGLRKKYNIKPPAVTGAAEFERGLRAQQNAIEFTPLFLIILWISAIFFHPVVASVSGLVYLFGRNRYFKGYLKSADGRLAPFEIIEAGLHLLLFQSIIGITQCLLLKYAGFNLKETVCSYVPFKSPF
ncbi:microsomal glutathione S-transferase 2-like [Saccoglossus kowalevskii]|uniref:Microsomal glutathione S-transferase 2-like n=1 Tax=Saccoglossus kowalevskii TaxID=10224 RepID=A0ABM0GNS2_SACKO|nr:PREDICTED: microsomal glutathione S-transferase 2-like [Saccoglossus kowalevskii]